MQMSEELDLIYRCFCCPFCSIEAEFNKKHNLRRHIKDTHRIEIQGRSGRRTIPSGIKFIEKKDISKYEFVQTRFCCVECDDMFEIINDLLDHFKYIHLNDIPDNSSTSTSKLAIKYKEISSNDEPPKKRKKTEEEAYEEIFKFETEREQEVTTSVLKSLNVKAASIKIENNGVTSEISVLTSQDNLNHLLASSEYPSKITVSTCKEQKAMKSTDDTAQVIPDDYLHNFLHNNNEYSGLIKYDAYKEVSEDLLKLLNTDWTSNPCIRLACAQLLSGSILVDAKQILLINCIEVYGRMPTLDRHFERFSDTAFDKTSVPTIANRYKKLNIKLIHNDNSCKLVLGTFVFTGLVTSSLRLDKSDFSPELGPSTKLFTPSRQTKVYLSHLSIKEASNIMNENRQLLSDHDIYAQLRQVRSKFVWDSSYSISRSLSIYTNNIACRPFTVFTVADAAGYDLEVDVKIGSRIFQQLANAFMFKDGYLEKEPLKKLQNGKDTKIGQHLGKLLSLFVEEETSLKAHGNQELGKILFDIAVLITPKLATYNDKVKDNIKKAICGLC